MKGVERRVFFCSECGKALVVDDLGMPCIRWASPDGRWAVLVKGGATIVLRSVDGTRRIVPCSMRNEEATCPPGGGRTADGPESGFEAPKEV